MLNKFPNDLKVHIYDQVICFVELYKIGGKTATKAATIFRRFQISYDLQLKKALYLWILNFNSFPGIPITPKLKFKQRSYASSKP